MQIRSRLKLGAAWLAGGLLAPLPCGAASKAGVAVVIAVSSYGPGVSPADTNTESPTYLPPLPSGANDAALMVENLLVAGFEPADIFVISNVDETSIRAVLNARQRQRYPVDTKPFVPMKFAEDPANQVDVLVKQVGEKTEAAHAEKVGFFVVYFSGHGVSFKDTNHVGGRGQRYLGLPFSRVNVASSWLPVDRLTNIIDAKSNYMSSTHNLMIVDACAPVVPIESASFQPVAGARVMQMFATEQGRFSYLDNNTNTSFFTYFLSFALVGTQQVGERVVPLLDDDGDIRLSEVSTVVQKGFESPALVRRLRNDAAVASAALPNGDPALTQVPEWHVSPIVFHRRRMVQP